ncbi:cell division protein ZapA [Legionella geestiana]|uniref:Cell division protein ZapA n=1 Tax=Legionella geestiana TaxID=45065 RepID=A0A0W0TNR8_9GAMM|nr:cell division protein ZapA [Legionella geestiana]KTC97248.1 cell division protein ZapA [Legionella geestiana]QBS12380.1 cell division protein ZapA [Legionella geestiana]QDQ39907.1 cell division protein ZapA [Legionella geestiana]STX55181.1 cell division protein ZapA [Legionella geestiana]
MTTSQLCTVRLLNRNYEFKCPEHTVETFQLAAARLNDALLSQKKKSKNLDEYQTLLLAALHLTHDLVTSEQQQESQRRQMTQFINSLEGKINQVVRGYPEHEPQTD